MYKTIVVTAVCPKPMRKRDVWRIDQFHLVKKIGSGYASSVYLAACHLTGNQVAIKLYHKSKLSELNLFQVSREVRIHGGLDHKNIVQLWAAFEDQYGIYLVTEFASKGDVFTEVERRGGQMTEAETVRQVIYPFCSALTYLHKNDIIHRDIKPENLLFTATGVLKVGDFGLSINISQERPVTRVGTLDYMAPEVVICPDKQRPSDNKEMKHLYYTCLVDAWAVGVLAYELIVGRPPFDKGAKKATIQEIINGEPFVPPWLSEGASHFIRWSLTKSQRDRPGVQQLMEHPWVMGHMTKGAGAAAHLMRPLNFGRADSFVEPRSMGLGPESPMKGVAPGGTATAFSNSTMTANPSLAAIKANAKTFLQHSNSLNAADNIRFRDLKFDQQQQQQQQMLQPERSSGTSPSLASALAVQKVSSPGMMQVGALPTATSGPSRDGLPTLEQRLSNLLQGSGSSGALSGVPPALAASRSSRRMSGLDNVMTSESRSRRQSGVGHGIPDPLPPTSPTDGLAASPSQLSLMLYANGDARRSPSNNHDHSSGGLPWPGLDIGTSPGSPGGGSSSGGGQRGGNASLTLSSNGASPRASSSRLAGLNTSVSMPMDRDGLSSMSSLSPSPSAVMLAAAPTRSRSICISDSARSVAGRPSPLRTALAPAGTTDVFGGTVGSDSLNSVTAGGGGGGSCTSPSAPLPPHPSGFHHHNHHQRDEGSSGTIMPNGLPSPVASRSSRTEGGSSGRVGVITPPAHFSRLSSSQGGIPSPLRNSSFARSSVSETLVAATGHHLGGGGGGSGGSGASHVPHGAHPSSTAHDAGLILTSMTSGGSSGGGAGGSTGSPRSFSPRAGSSRLLDERSSPNRLMMGNGCGGGGLDNLVLPTAPLNLQLSQGPFHNHIPPAGGRDAALYGTFSSSQHILPTLSEAPLSPAAASPRDRMSPRSAGSASPRGDATAAAAAAAAADAKKGIFASFKRVFS